MNKSYKRKALCSHIYLCKVRYFSDVSVCVFVCMTDGSGSEASKQVSVWEEVWTDATPGSFNVCWYFIMWSSY